MNEVKLIDENGMPYTYLGCVHNGGTVLIIVAYDCLGKIRQFHKDNITVDIEGMRESKCQK